MPTEVITELKEGKLWVQPCHLVKMYGLSRPTIGRYLKAMKGVAKYAKSIRPITRTSTLVKLEDFDNYLVERSRENERA